MQADYVVIGAGSAGCAVAGRLSECGNYSVIVIEAGPRDSNPWIHIPVGYFRTMGNPRSDWRYVTRADPGICGRAISWPRGRVLGGSSSINGLLYVRGQPGDFDHWRQLGNTGWAWDDVLPFFRKSENWRGKTDDPEGLRGKGGPLQVSPSRLTRDVVDCWIAAAKAAGYKETDDYNGGDQEGAGYFQLTQSNGRRCSSARAYLTPNLHRKNLTVLTDTQVERLVIEDGRVTGVQTVRKGQPKTITVNAEAILSAGAIGSPQILMLSGIGGAGDLTPHGIDVLRDLPGVGKNLQDHLQARPVYKTDLPTMNVETNSLFKQGLIALEYAIKRTGPMTMAASLGTAFLKTDPDMETPDIQFHIQPFSTDTPGQGTHRFSAFTASVLQLRPESTGHLALSSSDYRDHPAIHPNYLATATDQRTLVRGIQIARRIAKHEPLATHITEEHSPGIGVALDDNAATLDWARNTAVSIYHPTGTCKMGSDKMAVVDARLRVHGIKGLRVADASIMPRITSGNTNAPTIMIGEKAAAMILQDARA